MTARVLYSPDYISAYRDALIEARNDLRELAARHLVEMAALRRQLCTLREELDATRNAFDALRAISAKRQAAEAEVAELRRRRDLLRAFGVTRDPTLPLN